MSKSTGNSRTLTQPPVKLACLECRSCKVRCNGEDPCNNCVKRSKFCEYRASQRGGLRKRRRVGQFEDELGSDLVTGNQDFFAEALYNLSMPTELMQNLDLPESHFSQDSLDNLGPASTLVHDHPESVPIRVYNSELHLINAYYTFIHPFLPLLPPPEAPLHPDYPCEFLVNTKDISHIRMESLPCSFESPLSMAVAAMLVLIPRDDVSYDSSADSAAIARRTVAQLYSQAALQLFDEDIGCFGSMTSGCTSPQLNRPHLRKSLHRDLPVDIEGLIALLLLSVYEYCQRGNLSKMRARINQALLQAMDMGLHCITELAHDFQEAKKRAWWWTIHLLYQISTLQILRPHILLSDSRITTPYPEFHVSPEPWSLYLKAQDTYLHVACFVQELESQFSNSESVTSTYRHEIDRFDSKLRLLMAETNEFAGLGPADSIEAIPAKNIWYYTRSTVNSARLRLYRFIAFSQRPIFLWRHCDLPTLNQSTPGDTPITASIEPRSLTMDNTIFPKGKEDNVPHEAMHASKICLKSALAFTRSFAAICSVENYAEGTVRRPRPLPSFACCAMQSAYTLLILLYTLKHALSSGSSEKYRELLPDPEVGTESHDVERLIQELCDNVSRMLRTMDNCFSMFEGVKAMPEDVRNAFQYITAAGDVSNDISGNDHFSTADERLQVDS